MKPTWNRRLRAVCAAYLYPWAYLVIRCRRPIVVGITGSVGKTTTTDLIARVLQANLTANDAGAVWKSEGNMNDDLGIPLTVLGFDRSAASNVDALSWMLVAPFRAIGLATFLPYPKILVLEFGAGWGSDLGRNARLAPPLVAAVTAVGPAHLEKFGTLEGIVEEKSGLIRNVPVTGLVLLGSETSLARGMHRYTGAPVIEVPGRGRALSENMARHVAGFFEFDEGPTEQAIAAFTSYTGRLQVVEHGAITLIDDSFNANPLSMKLALDTLASLGAKHDRTVAILGMMGELGEEAPRYHQEIADYARTRASVVIGVGDLARFYNADRYYDSSEDCVKDLDEIVRPGDCVLVKGSHAAHMQSVAAALSPLARRETPTQRARARYA